MEHSNTASELKDLLKIRPQTVTKSAKLYFQTEMRTVTIDILLQDMLNSAEAFKKSLEETAHNLEQVLEQATGRKRLHHQAGPPPPKPPDLGQTLAEMMFARLIDNFETYLSDIIREAILAQPKLLRSKEQVRLDYILQFESIDDLVTGLVERKVNELSYSDFEELENWFADRLGLPLLTDNSMREVIVELIETRNLIVHNRAQIGEKYLRNVPNTSFKVGDVHAINLDYFTMTLKTLDPLVISLDERLAKKFSLPTESLT